MGQSRLALEREVAVARQLFAQFPIQNIRENILNIREISRNIRESKPDGRKVPSNSASSRSCGDTGCPQAFLQVPPLNATRGSRSGKIGARFRLSLRSASRPAFCYGGLCATPTSSTIGVPAPAARSLWSNNLPAKCIVDQNSRGPKPVTGHVRGSSPQSLRAATIAIPELLRVRILERSHEQRRTFRIAGNSDTAAVATI